MDARDAHRALRCATLLFALSFASGCDWGVFDDLQRNLGDAGRDASERDDSTPEAGSGGDSGRDAPAAGSGGRAGDSAPGGPGGPGGAGGRAGSPTEGDQDAGAEGCSRAAEPSNVRMTVTDLGALPVPDSLAWRAVGPIVRVGERLAWLVMETDTSGPHVSWSNFADLLATPPKLTTSAPTEPLFPPEFASDPTILKPSAALVRHDNELLVFVTRYGGAFSLYPDALGITRLTIDAERASVVAAPGALFPAAPAADGGTAPWHPSSLSGAFIEGGFLYGYVCHPKPDAPDEQAGGAHEQPCRMLRAPEGMLDRANGYQFWTGDAWSDDWDRAAIVLERVPSGLSAAFNGYLGKYLVVHSGGNNDVLLRWSDQPTGPFEEFARVPTLEATAGFALTFNALEHPTLRQDCDRTLFISYVLPLTTTTPEGEGMERRTHLLKVELR